MKAKDESCSSYAEDALTWIRDQTKRAGFIDVTVVTLDGIDPGYETYQDWIEEGHHQPLDYLAKNREFRKEPQKLEEGLRSAFVFLHPYPNEDPSAMIAKYAWGKDYHQVIKKKLFEMSDAYEKTFGPLESQRICVDTAPILERSIAQRAGLGWIGKNGCLISRKHGSFFLIATWMTSLRGPDLPATASSFHCGKCTRCLDACPTDAFIQPGTLDASLCLSTQTIENRSTFPKEMIGKLNEQAFGCDICQDVCPWNRKHFPDAPKESLPDLNSLLLLPEQAFRDHFRKTPMERPTWSGLRRNFLVLSANRGDVPDETIASHLQDERDLVSSTARDVLNYRASKKKPDN